MKVLIINTHLSYPGWSEGKLNLALVEIAKTFFLERGHQVTETLVERGYQPEDEVNKHAAADLVILQTPVNWFGAPWIHKKYVDEVFNASLVTKVLITDDGRTRKDSSRQYGTGGKMQGKKFMVSATWNAPADAFDNSNGVLFDGKGTADVLLNITSSYKFCGCDVLPDFGVFDVVKKTEAIPAAFEEYKRHLETHCLPGPSTPVITPSSYAPSRETVSL